MWVAIYEPIRVHVGEGAGFDKLEEMFYDGTLALKNENSSKTIYSFPPNKNKTMYSFPPKKTKPCTVSRPKKGNHVQFPAKKKKTMYNLGSSAKSKLYMVF